MKVFHWIILLASVSFVGSADRKWRKRARTVCSIHPRLQDKWHFLSQRRSFVRIRARHFIFKTAGTKAIKYRCVKNMDDTYLLRKRNYLGNDSAVVCLGFKYIADHPKAEYNVIRLSGEGDGSHVMSPVLVPKKSKLSIKSSCDVSGRGQYGPITYPTRAFIRRSPPGCKFPKNIQGRWNFTYQHAKSLEIWSRNSTLHLMNGERVKFHCDKKDGGIYVFRASKYVDDHTDAIMCAEFIPMSEKDPFYKFKVSRHNSGRILDNQLKPIPSIKTIFVQVDCDWIGSPSQPMFLYP